MVLQILKYSKRLILLQTWLLIIGCSPLNEQSKIEQRIENLLAQMTLEEKINQMSQVRHFENLSDEDIATKTGSVIHTQGPTPGTSAEEWQARFIELQKIALSTRLGIPLIFGVDAVHGQNTFEGATIFPHNIGLGATFNENLVERCAEITALEVQATGFNWTFAPCIAIPYNEKWGRVYEAFSEDPDLTSRLGKAAIRGLQKERDPDQSSVLATAKHYIGDGSTDQGVEGGNTSISLKEVSEILLPPYEAAVQEGVGAIMVSFNSLSGISMHAHKALITDTLKMAMGFNGMVVSDWRGYSRFGGNEIINAGVDMVMAVEGDLEMFQKGLAQGVEDGSVSMERIDDAVRRILRQKFKLGLFENPFPNTKITNVVGQKSHRDIARKAVRESLVLLKNDEDVLPIDRTTNKIVVVGEHANNTGYQSGGWSINWQGTDQNYAGAKTILEGIKRIFEGEVVYDQKGDSVHQDADLAIVVVGETPYAEFMGDIKDGEGTYQLQLSEAHQNYINTYVELNIPVVTVLISGRPLVVTEQIEQSHAFIAAWLPGSEGDGIAEVLFGDYNFSGRLPHS
jgi:beta-glucosidase